MAEKKTADLQLGLDEQLELLRLARTEEQRDRILRLARSLGISFEEAFEQLRREEMEEERNERRTGHAP